MRSRLQSWLEIDDNGHNENTGWNVRIRSPGLEGYMHVLANTSTGVVPEEDGQGVCPIGMLIKS